MAFRFALVTEEQLLSINKAAFPKTTKMATKFSGYLLRLTSFDHLTCVTLCTWKSIMRRDFHLLLCAFVSVMLKLKQILDQLIIQLVWYTKTITGIHLQVKIWTKRCKSLSTSLNFHLTSKYRYIAVLCVVKVVSSLRIICLNTWFLANKTSIQFLKITKHPNEKFLIH